MATLDLRHVASPAVRDLLHLVNHPDFDRTQQQIERLGGCTEPVRLTGHTATVDITTGEVLRAYTTSEEPTGSLLTACGNRRASRCPACSRLYAADHDRPGPQPDRAYAELVGGPLDGLLLDITGWSADEIETGAALMTELGQFGAGGRALYDPRPGERNRWDWFGDTP